jgi:HemK-like putative methylase
MTRLEDELRLAFQKLGCEHEVIWVCQHIKANSCDEQSADALVKDIIQRRNRNEPLAYIFGQWPFLGLQLKVGPGVLIPRPETEELAEKMATLLVELGNKESLDEFKILDLGAGSGALGLGVADACLNKLPQAKIEVESVERSKEAQEILNFNLEAAQALRPNHLKVTKHACSWNDLEGAACDVDLVLGNPPYVSDKEWCEDVDNSVKNFEPRTALTPEGVTHKQVSLGKGLELSLVDLTKFALGPFLENIKIASDRLRSGGILGIEIGPAQARVLTPELFQKIENKYKLRLDLVRDLSAKLRFVIGHKNG